MKILRYLFVCVLLINYSYAQNPKRIAYLVSDIRIPFWNTISKGMKQKSEQMGYQIDIYSADNSKKNELQNTIKALSQDIDGLVVSPIDSSTAVTILDFAKKSKVPVVIADIGTDDGEYVSFISSDNEDGAYKIGKLRPFNFKVQQNQTKLCHHFS